MANAEAEETLRGWFTGRLPTDWFTAVPDIALDREEIVIIGDLAPAPGADEAGEAERAAAAAGRIKAFREDTREVRMAIAREAEHRFGRKVAWGAQCGDRREVFTSMSVPVMTRLRQPDRKVLDTLVDAGVARSRSDALAWCVRLVGRNTDTWPAELRDALQSVQTIRAPGPDAGA